MDVARLQAELREFARARDWEKFHEPKNLTMALTVEAAELMELFQWSTDSESRDARSDPAILDAARAELADVLIYLLRISDVLGIDLDAAVRTKIALNADKYPIDLSKGNATKYDRRSR
jgi:NTP pyrophosphatase (non-canonical NTP hydrolase)